MQARDRIAVDPAVLAGKPVIRGTRVPVHLVLALLGSGLSRDDVLKEYPQLTREDIDAAVLYASRIVESTELVEFGVV